jgi:hypothetical protein
MARAREGPRMAARESGLPLNPQVDGNRAWREARRARRWGDDHGARGRAVLRRRRLNPPTTSGCTGGLPGKVPSLAWPT